LTKLQRLGYDAQLTSGLPVSAPEVAAIAAYDVPEQYVADARQQVHLVEAPPMGAGGCRVS
jgi:hypothetical protein